MFSLALCTFLDVNVLHKGLLLQDWVFRLGIYLIWIKEFCATFFLGGGGLYLGSIILFSVTARSAVIH